MNCFLKFIILDIMGIEVKNNALTTRPKFNIFKIKKEYPQTLSNWHKNKFGK